MDAPIDLYIAAYDDPAAAKEDYDDLKKLQHGGYIFIDGAVLVSRETDGKMTVKETGDHDVFKGTGWGIAGGFVIGLFAPPLLAATVVGAVAGGVIGKLAKSHQERGHRQGRRELDHTGHVGRGRRVRGDLGRRGRDRARQGQPKGGQAGRQGRGQGTQGRPQGRQEAGQVGGVHSLPSGGLGAAPRDAAPSATYPLTPVSVMPSMKTR